MKELSCPPHKTLESLLAATLSDEQQTIVTSHIEDCQACQARLESLTGDQSLHSFSHDKKTSSTEAPPPWLLSQLLKSTHEGYGADEVLSFLKPALQEGDLGQLGAYRIKRVLGRGGMGVVLLGYDTMLKRLVALKVLWPPPGDLSSRSRVIREAQAVASIHHDHVVGIYAVQNEPGEPPYLAMEYVPGKTLKEYFKQQDVAVSQYLNWCIEIAEGLSAAHAAGLIHRDIKPTNILIDENTQKAKLTDFGLARASENQTDQTRQVLLAGTPAYMSPEQIQHPELVDQRSDVYGLGATLYEAITGTPPHRGPVEELIRQVVDIEPIPPRRLNLSIPVDVETICMKCLAKEPSQRYASTSHLADDVRRYLDGQPILARPLSWLERSIKAIIRRPLISALGALLLISFVAGTLVSLYYWRRAEQNLIIANEKIDTAFLTIDRFCLRVSEDRLLSEAGMLPLRQELLQIAIPELQKLSLDRPSDPKLHEKWIKSTYLLAKLKHDIEGPAQALPLLQSVMPDLRERHHLRPGSDADRRLLADVLMYEGICRENMRHFSQADMIWKEIEQLLLDQQAPEDQLILARLYVNWNKTWADQGNYHRSDQYAKKAQSISKVLTVSHQELNEARYILAASTGNIAHGQVGMGQLIEAEKSYHQAIALWQEITRDEPKQVMPEIEKLRTQINLIDLLLASSRYDEVSKLVANELPAIDRLIRKYPQSITLTRFYGTLHIDAGYAFHLNGKAAEAERHYQLAVARLNDCHTENPNEIPIHYDLIRARLLQAYQCQDARQLDKAIASWEEILSMLHDYVGEVPGAEQEMKLYRQAVLMCRAMAKEELGQPASAKVDIQSVLHDEPNYPGLCHITQLLVEERSTGQDQTTEMMKHYRKMIEECLAGEKLGPSPATLYYLAANGAARSVMIIAKDSSLKLAEAQQLSEQYRSAALRWLQAARSYGYFAAKERREALAKNPSLSALHQTPEWKALLSELK
ncbi:MAG TPA: serine/threonine-protein kinase [Gemmatales bacterium]|nr:serine/threonine-protein kinase [Gemmatales bacterium]